MIEGVSQADSYALYERGLAGCGLSQERTTVLCLKAFWKPRYLCHVRVTT